MKTTRQEKFVQMFPRLKQTAPFSQRLNDWIENWFDNHKHIFKFVDTDDFDSDDIEATFKKHTARFQTEGVIHIWTGASDNTIFGEPTINHKFRAWHDFIHITQGYGYDFVGESICSVIQQSQLPNNWHFEKNLIHCEIVGQAQYFMLHGEFLKDQRKFTHLYLIRPDWALKNKEV